MFNLKSKALKSIAKVGAVVVAGAASAYSSVATADWIADASTALTAAGTDGKTVGGYVIVVVAGMAVVGLVVAVIKKMG